MFFLLIESPSILLRVPLSELSTPEYERPVDRTRHLQHRCFSRDVMHCGLHDWQFKRRITGGWCGLKKGMRITAGGRCGEIPVSSNKTLVINRGLLSQKWGERGNCVVYLLAGDHISETVWRKSEGICSHQSQLATEPTAHCIPIDYALDTEHFAIGSPVIGP